MFHIPNQVTTLYSLRAHDHQLRDENALRLLHSKQIPTSKLDVFLKSALDLASTVVPMDTALLADVLPSLLEEELWDDIQIPELLSVAKPPSNFLLHALSTARRRTATAAAGQIVYRYADFASNVVLIAQEPVIPENCAVPQKQTNFCRNASQQISEPSSPSVQHPVFLLQRSPKETVRPPKTYPLQEILAINTDDLSPNIHSLPLANKPELLTPVSALNFLTSGKS